MSLNAPPVRGFADFGRTVPWDSASVWLTFLPLGNTGHSSGIVDVSRYAYLAGWIAGSTGRCLFSIVWFADAAGTQQLGGRQFVIDTSISNAAQLRIPNLGPFMQASVGAIGGVNYSANLNLSLTNRFHPLELIPADHRLVLASNVALAALTTTIIWPINYYAGPVRVWTSTPAAGWFVDLYSYDLLGNKQFIEQTAAPNGNSAWSSVVPPGAWRAEVTNGTAAAGNYYLSVTPSFTGAL